MKEYVVMPMDWNYDYETTIRDYGKKGVYAPCEIEELVDKCGSLYPFIKSQGNAIEYAKDLKSKYPFVVFNVMVGNSFGDLELVKTI